MRAIRMATTVVLSVAVLAGCTDGSTRPDSARSPAPNVEPSPTPSASPSASTSPSQLVAPSPTISPTPSPRASVGDVRVATAVAAVDHLAGEVGPRHGTSVAFQRAARWVAARLDALGYDVRRQPFDVPAGTSWGVPVDAGRSVNVVATQGAVDLSRWHRVVGAHLDTVPRAPGAEDNASGVGALLSVAEAVAGRRTGLPVVFVVFGAEEPRGPADDDHHYGSRHYVGRLSPDERSAVRGMLSLDRVGVGTVMPVCSATSSGGAARAEVLAAAERAGVSSVLPCTDNRASDHWSFVRDGLPGVRLGSTSYAGYHSPGDVPSVVNAAQLHRAARVTVAWLAGS